MTEMITDKYNIIPSQEQVEAIRSYFKILAERQTKALKRQYGLIEFVQKNLLNDAMIGSVINSQSYLSSTLVYLQGEGHIKRIRRSSPAGPSLWDVSNLITDGQSVVTKEDLGMNPNYKRDRRLPDVEIELISSIQKEEEPVVMYEEEPQQEHVEDVPAEAPVDNVQVLDDIKESMNDMIGHLQQLPIEFNNVLRDLTATLSLADPSVLTSWEKEKQSLSNQIAELETALSETNEQLSQAKSELAERPKEIIKEVPVENDYSKEYIEGQCRAIENKVIDIMATPWKINKHKNDYKDFIKGRLTNIKKNLGIVQ
jgi:hypothetical protein